MKVDSKISANTLLWVGGGVAGYFFVLKPILEGLGLKDSKEDRENKASETKNPGWSTSFWKVTADKKKPAAYMKQSSANAIAKALKKLQSGSLMPRDWMDVISPFGGVFNTKEEQIYAIFKNLKSKVQLSQIANSYLYYNKTDLFKDLESDLSDSEFNTVVRYADNLPTYK